MKLTVERIPESQVVLDIAADEEEFAKALERAYRKVGQQAQVPGFRRGKAPRTIIERMYGREVFLEETRRELMDRLYREALESAAVSPVGEPEVELTALEPLAFKVTVPVYPTIDPGPYTEARHEPADASIDETEVERSLGAMRAAQSPWVDPAEPRLPTEGDQVTIDLTVAENGEQFDEPITDAVFVLGESSLFPELRATIEGLQVGETGSAEITFPEDAEDVSDRVKGKTLTYQITLKGLKAKELLPLDDEFAFTAANAPSLQALRAQIHTDLHRARTAEARTSVVNGIIAAIAERATIEVPSVMVDEAVTEEVNGLRQRLAQQRTSLEEYLRSLGQTEEEMREELRPDAARRLRNSLLLREIAKREGIAVSDADLEAEVAGITAGADNAQQLRDLYLGQGYFRNMLANDLFDRKLTNRLIEIATEGRPAVTNGFVEPEPVVAESATGDQTAGTDETTATGSEAAASADETAGTGAGGGEIVGDGGETPDASEIEAQAEAGGGIEFPDEAVAGDTAGTGEGQAENPTVSG